MAAGSASDTSWVVASWTCCSVVSMTGNYFDETYANIALFIIVDIDKYLPGYRVFAQIDNVLRSPSS
jgi:hypothetical protein